VARVLHGGVQAAPACQAGAIRRAPAAVTAGCFAVFLRRRAFPWTREQRLVGWRSSTMPGDVPLAPSISALSLYARGSDRGCAHTRHWIGSSRWAWRRPGLPGGHPRRSRCLPGPVGRCWLAPRGRVSPRWVARGHAGPLTVTARCSSRGTRPRRSLPACCTSWDRAMVASPRRGAFSLPVIWNSQHWISLRSRVQAARGSPRHARRRAPGPPRAEHTALGGRAPPHGVIVVCYLFSRLRQLGGGTYYGTDIRAVATDCVPPPGPASWPSALRRVSSTTSSTRRLPTRTPGPRRRVGSCATGQRTASVDFADLVILERRIGEAPYSPRQGGRVGGDPGACGAVAVAKPGARAGTPDGFLDDFRCTCFPGWISPCLARRDLGYRPWARQATDTLVATRLPDEVSHGAVLKTVALEIGRPLGEICPSDRGGRRAVARLLETFPQRASSGRRVRRRHRSVPRELEPGEALNTPGCWQHPPAS